jgi:hypothetical protein
MPKLYRQFAQIAISLLPYPPIPGQRKSRVLFTSIHERPADLPTVVPHLAEYPLSKGTEFELCKIHLTEFMTCFTHMTRDLDFMWSVEADVGHLLEPELNPKQ